MAQDLIKDKINLDIQEMTPEEQKLVSSKKDIFITERYEHLLKGIYTTAMSVGAMPTTSNNIMDHNKYEDFARQLLGQNAFLLFQIDKIVSQSIKQLQSMYSDTVC